MIDITQSSEDTDSDTVIATNRMSTHINFFLPEFHTTSVLQKGSATLGSAMEADRPYEKEELDHYYTTVTTTNTWMDPFTIIVQVPPPDNTTSPTTLACCSSVRPYALQMTLSGHSLESASTKMGHSISTVLILNSTVTLNMML